MPRRAIILVAEADAAVRASLAFSFELEGFRVQTMASASELQAATLPESGCVIADLALGGNHGLALLRELRMQRPDLSAILIATHPGPAIRAEASLARIPIVEKPLLGNTLVESVRGALEEAA